MKKTLSVCQYCKIEFYRKKSPKPKYCSPSCYKQAAKASTPKRDVCCQNCGVKFERRESQLSKSKHGVNFCSRKCKDTAQRLNGDIRIHPEHYHNNKGIKYSTKARRMLNPKCVDCDISIPVMLEIHHIDGNRLNNDLTNLEIVCANHHRIRHLYLDNEEWKYASAKLTPRDLLDKFKKDFSI